MKATIVGYRGYKAYGRFSKTLPISAVDDGGKRPGDVAISTKLPFFPQTLVTPDTRSTSSIKHSSAST
jgi:hypothetical protein